jgi:EAL domain-containing protein (putative c-di-GMP-specific phosphodiesterase class I)
MWNNLQRDISNYLIWTPEDWILDLPQWTSIEGIFPMKDTEKRKQNESWKKMLALWKCKRSNTPSSISATTSNLTCEILRKFWPWDDMWNLFKQNISIACDVINKNPNYKLSITINVDPTEIWKNNFYETILSITKGKNIEPSRLIIEIVEKTFWDEETKQKIINNIKKTKDLWVQFAIDDLNLFNDRDNHSVENFIYIVNNWIKPEYIKIDWLYLKLLLEKKWIYLEDFKSLVVFLKKMWIKVVAEHVENEELFDLSLELDVDFIQWDLSLSKLRNPLFAIIPES